MTYVYPVISRRAGGVSLGINLNPNHACNWHCAYCQVPDLQRGSAPAIDLDQLRDELTAMLKQIQHGDFMLLHVPEECRQLCDVAISGNGEPTSCRAFDDVVTVILEVMQLAGLAGKIPLRLISNGSYVHKPDVQRGLGMMQRKLGEVWIKIDAATEEGIARINGVHATPDLLKRQVQHVAKLCPTWIQTCMLAWDGQPPADVEIEAYLQFLQALKHESVPLLGVLLYGLARPSLQVESAHVSALSKCWMNNLKKQIESLDIEVRLSL